MDMDFEVNMNEYLPLRDVVFNTLRKAILRGEEKGPKRKASVLLSCWDARGCSQEGEPVDQIGRRAPRSVKQSVNWSWKVWF